MGTMKNLIIVAHPDRKSFCYSGIVRTIVKTLKVNKEDVKIIDLYAENTSFVFEFNKI